VEEVLPPWAALTTWVGIVVTVVLSLFKGWLVPKSQLDRLVGQLEARLDDRDELIAELRQANAIQDARSDLLQSTLAHVLTVVEDNNRLTRAILTEAGALHPQALAGQIPSGAPGLGPPPRQAIAGNGGAKVKGSAATGRRRRNR